MSVSSLQAQDLAGMDPKWRQALLGVSAHGVLLPPNGKLHLVDAGGPDTLIQTAVDTAVSGDVILIAGAAEYNEDVTVSTSGLTLVGAGPRDSVRITGTAAGTKTAMTLDGVSDVGLYNLNLEGRTSSGSALVMNGQIRRVHVAGCKLHGGDQAVLLEPTGGGQMVDIRIEDCNIANSATGISASTLGEDPGHRIFVRGNLFSKITTACIVEDGPNRDWNIYNNVFSTSDGTEPTLFLDIDETGTTGFVAGNWFATATNATGANAIAAGVDFVGNYTQAGISTDVPQ